MRDAKKGTYNGDTTYCPVNAYGDCPYCDRCDICHIDDPMEDCSDWGAFFDSWDDWLNADDVNPDAPDDFADMKKILDLQKALEAIGIETELETEAQWYGSDNKTHYGIELSTNMDYGEDAWSFMFTPNGKYITKCTEAPTKK